MTRLWKTLPLVLVSLLLGGCGKFFVPNTTTGGGGSTATGNYLYVANQATQSIAGFGVSTTGLSVTSGSPYPLGIAPTAIAVTPSGTFLYAATAAGIYGYSIGSNGQLSLLNNGSAIISEFFPVAMKVDPSGNWLIAADLTPSIYAFSINTSTGILTEEGTGLTLDAGSPDHIAITPNESFIYVSLDTGGVDVLSFSSNAGSITGPTAKLAPLQSGNADVGLAVDPGSKYLFVTETGSNDLRVFSIGTTGGLTPLSGSPYTTGQGPKGIVVDSTGSYVYVANYGGNSISAYSLVAAGTLTEISGSPFPTGANPIDLTEDVGNTYIAVACYGGSQDMQVFTINTTTTPGALTSFATATTGTDPTIPVAIVAAK